MAELREEDFTQVFQLVAAAGDSKSYSMEAIEHARAYQFDEARECLKQADEQMHQAHNIQFDILSAESGGKGVPLSLLMVHAQDHLTMAILARDQAEEFLHLYEVLEGIQKQK